MKLNQKKLKKSWNKNSIKVLHTEASLGWGGQEIRICQEALGMRERGYWVGIAASPLSEIYHQALQFNLPIFSVSFENKSFKSVKQILKIIKAKNITILNTHSSWDSWVGGITKLFISKLILIRTRHLSTPIGRNPLSWLIYNVLPDYIITTGEEIRFQMINRNKFNPKKIISIPTGVDLKVFDPQKVKNSLPKDGFLIGVISVLRSWKGHQYFLEAIPEILKFIPEAKFYIVGDGPQRENIKNVIKNLGLENKIFMLGYRKDIPEILTSLDILVLASYGHEGVPQVILQALAMKKAVVATNVGSVKEVIKNKKTGILIPSKNSYAIAEAIINLYKSPTLRKQLGEAGRKLVEEKYSLERMLDRIEKIYHSLILK